MMKKSWQRAYDMGLAMSAEYDTEREALNAMSLNDMEMFLVAGCSEWFHAGFIGREPELVRAFRYGNIPEAGRSINYAENAWEPGVSCVRIIRKPEDADEQTLYGMLGREKIIVEGWYLGNVGSDGEPCLWGCERIA